MERTFNNALASVEFKRYRKGNEKELEKQQLEPIYKDIANPEAVKAEIGDIIRVFNQEIKAAKREVDEKKAEKPIKYSQRAFYSQDLNATIKENLILRMESDTGFNNKIRVRKNSGSVYFIVNDRYILYVKRLYGNQNKPNSYPTPKSSKLFDGSLFPGGNEHIPVLFIGPNLGNINETDAFVTSLINRYEINWSLSSVDLFNESIVKQLEVQKVKQEKVEKQVVRLKDGLGKPVQKKGNR